MLLRILIIGVVFALLIGGGLAWMIERPEAAGTPVISTPVKNDRIGGPFQLIDQTGRTVTDEDFRGRYLLIYFGYTYCPDVCPAELQIMSSALDKLGSDAGRIQPLFVTVDPERDTVDVMAQYVSHFNPQLLGLTGTVDQVARMAKEYKVYFAKQEPERGGDKAYSVSHSSLIYLMSPSGRFIDHFSFGTNPDEMASRIKSHL